MRVQLSLCLPLAMLLRSGDVSDVCGVAAVLALIGVLFDLESRGERVHQQHGYVPRFRRSCFRKRSFAGSQHCAYAIDVDLRLLRPRSSRGREALTGAVAHLRQQVSPFLKHTQRDPERLFDFRGLFC